MSEKTLTELRTEVEKKIEEYNDNLLKKSDVATMSALEKEIKEAEVAYSEAKREEVFKSLSKSSEPIKAAITAHDFLIVGHRAVKEGGVITGFELVDDKVRQIDLVKFCKYCHLDTTWQYKVEKFNQLLALRAANELKLSKAQIKKLSDSFYMNDLARKLEMGETPDSNTAICKLLQQVLDAIIFEDNGKGKNKYKANNHDVAYLLMCYTKRGKKKLSVAVAKNNFVHALVMDVAHRIVTGLVYDLEYKVVKETGENANKQSEKVSEKPEKTPETVEVEKSA